MDKTQAPKNWFLATMKKFGLPSFSQFLESRAGFTRADTLRDNVY